MNCIQAKHNFNKQSKITKHQFHSESVSMLLEGILSFKADNRNTGRLCTLTEAWTNEARYRLHHSRPLLWCVRCFHPPTYLKLALRSSSSSSSSSESASLSSSSWRVPAAPAASVWCKERPVLAAGDACSLVLLGKIQ